MKLTVLCFASLTACAVEPAEPAAPETIDLTKCDSWMCGTNSPVMNGLGFHELDLDGLPNQEGFALKALAFGSSTYKLTVRGGVIGAAKIQGPAADPVTLSTPQLIDLAIPIDYKGTTEALRIHQVHATSYWAVPVGWTAHPSLTTYVIEWNATPPDDKWQPLCAKPSPLEDLGMYEYHALVFEGERIDDVKKTVAPTIDRRWFNIGCAGSTLAKLQLTGHTQVAADTYPFVTTIAERQTMVKMLSGDYCGTGKPFTVAGQPLQWADDQHTMTVSPGGQLEAQWTPTGASCLDVPRVVRHPTALSEAMIGSDDEEVEANIASECTRPVHCSALPPVTGVHLWSWNPN